MTTVLSWMGLGFSVVLLAVTLSAVVSREHSCPAATPGTEATTAICRAVNG